MADPFKPKFVDLVRNFTATTGSGNLVLGPTVTGFRSLIGAVAPGDQFYYCVMGVDKPAEREVGRGTLMPDGSVARAPIEGPATNFSSGTKTFALVAAAEWFKGAAQWATPQMFGARGDGTTDDHNALQAWLDSGGHLHIPAGKYRSSQRLLVRRFVRVTTAGYGFDSRIINTMGLTLADMPGSQIRFDAGVGGLYFMNQSLVDDVATNVSNPNLHATQEGSFQSHFGPIGLIGGGGASATGVYARTLVHLDGVQVYNFAGKGFDISASADVSDGNSEYGNASLSTLKRCLAKSNGSHGFHIRGRDANVISLDSCNAQENGGWAFLDDGLLGNTYHNCHAASNALGNFKGGSSVGDHVYTGCYVEGGTGSNAYLSSRCLVIGGILSEIASPTSATTNGAPMKPTVFGPGATNISDLQFQTSQENFGAITGTAHIFRHANNGLTLQGSPGAGGTYSVSLRNSNDQPLLQFGSTNTNAYFAGPILVGGNQVLAERGAAVANATDAASAITQLNALLSRCRAHGLIA